MTREEWTEFEHIKNNGAVLLAMRARCEEHGHEWENCCSATFNVYMDCKWCGAIK